ncbi:RNase H1/viroplasmin domain-containing protein, partial [Corynebacterium sp. MC-02]|nr:RNase H1/viroplasmin domain-containing protein [Corynebacterium pseudokroppenstedtii]
IDRPQKCLIDNLWQAYNKKDIKYFIACLNALSQYFTEKNIDKKFKYYVVIHGKINGVFHTWQEVIDSIKEVKNPLFKGFNDFCEALDYARGALGPNYFISPTLRHYISQSPNQSPQYKVQKDTDKIIFCDHCEAMTEGFKRLNTKCADLIKERDQLLLLLGKTDKGKRPQTSEQSSPSPSKMDEKGVHSPLNATRPTVSGIDTASPVQTATGKDLSSPLMAVTLPKSEEEPDTPPGLKLRRKRKVAIKKKTIEDILRNALNNMIKEAEQEKQIDPRRSENPSPEPSSRPAIEDEDKSDPDNEGFFQDSQDPNEGYDSPMSFDSIALHNLDTIG